jgi:DNA-binding transcriptional LysR family regulator
MQAAYFISRLLIMRLVRHTLSRKSGEWSLSSIEDYAVFLAVIDHGSLTAAARKLGRSLQATSRVLASLERELGVQLVARTTRKLAPTAIGLAFADRIRGALADIELAREELADAGEKIGGRIRIAASTLFGPRYVLPALAAAAERHSNLEIELTLSDQHTDLISEGIDIAVRIGALPDSGLIARRIGALRRVLCAAPGYLAKHGRPLRPSDLTQHACVLRLNTGANETWMLREGDTPAPVAVRGRFRSDNATARNDAAALGAGITLAPLWQVRSLVDEGRLDLILTEYEPQPIPLHLVWPAGPRLPRRTRVLVDLLTSRLREAVTPAPS